MHTGTLLSYKTTYRQYRSIRFDDSFDSDEERKILAQGFEGCSGIPSRARGKRCCFPGLCGDVGLGRRLSRFLSLLRMNHLSCSTGRQSLDPLSAGWDIYTSTHNAKLISSLRGIFRTMDTKRDPGRNFAAIAPLTLLFYLFLTLFLLQVKWSG